MDEEKKSVILYTEWARPLQNLPLEDVGRIFQAILDYAETKKEPAFDNRAAAVAFEFIRLQIDRNSKRWESKREARSNAGRSGAQKRWNRRQSIANDSKPWQTIANMAVNVNVNDNVNVNGNVSSSSINDDDRPPGGGEMTMTMMEPEKTWVSLGLGEAGPALEDMLNSCRERGMEDAVLSAAIRRTAEYAPRAALPYLRSMLESAIAKGCTTLAAWDASHKGGSRAKRVDRETPSGNDFLANAMERPIRRKRKE